MTESIWLPGLFVLGVGVLVGAIAALRMRRASAATDEGDIELRVADLMARRDELYERLRSAVAKRDDGEIERLEIAAARVLRDLGEGAGELPPGRADRVTSVPVRDATAGTGWASRHPLTIGFAFGAGLVSLVGLLFYWAAQDAGPRADGAGMAAASAAEAPPHEEVALSPQVAARVSELEIALAQSPDDLQARRELALIRLQASQYMEAFQQAGEILDRAPRDLDALYVQGVVRLTMGQLGVAKDQFDQVISIYPQHVRALVARGVILFRLGDRAAAIADWEAGIVASGGSNPEIEELLARAREVDSEDASPVSSGPAARTTGETGGSAAGDMTGEAARPPASGPTFRARLDVERPVRPGAVLFVSILGQTPGPPVAVRRIEAPRFPLEIALDARDSMLGRPLPETGTLSARLDADGSVSTREPTDPSAEIEIAAGDRVELVLK